MNDGLHIIFYSALTLFVLLPIIAFVVLAWIGALGEDDNTRWDAPMPKGWKEDQDARDDNDPGQSQ